MFFITKYEVHAAGKRPALVMLGVAMMNNVVKDYSLAEQQESPSSKTLLLLTPL